VVGAAQGLGRRSVGQVVVLGEQVGAQVARLGHGGRAARPQDRRTGHGVREVVQGGIRVHHGREDAVDVDRAGARPGDERTGRGGHGSGGNEGTPSHSGVLTVRRADAMLTTEHTTS